MEIDKAVITGAASFTGVALAECLLEKRVEVYALMRPGSGHNRRLDALRCDRLHAIESTPEGYGELGIDLHGHRAVLFHLLWGGRKGVREQAPNIGYAISAVELAHMSGCERFVGVGSQAEYGIVPPYERMAESLVPAPVSSYGTAKVPASYLTRERARELNTGWVWARIFSLIGRREPAGRMLPDLYRTLKEGRDFYLSSGRQNWDYLDVYDAANALIALAEGGRDGEVYNVANGAYRPLLEYTEELKKIVGGSGQIHYGEDPKPFLSLQPSVEKIYRDTGWQAERSFAGSVADYELGE